MEHGYIHHLTLTDTTELDTAAPHGPRHESPINTITSPPLSIFRDMTSYLKTMRQCVESVKFTNPNEAEDVSCGPTGGFVKMIIYVAMLPRRVRLFSKMLNGAL